MPLMTFKELAALSLANITTVLSHFLPGGRQEGPEYVVKNPTRADSQPGSFKVNTSTGLWSEFAGSSAGGNDLISLVAYLQRSTQGEAAKALTELLGVTPKADNQGQKQKVTAYYIYHDANGSPVLKVERVESGEVKSNGKKEKQFFQYHRDRGQWKSGANGNFLLYNLPGVLAASTVFFVEGEEKCEVLKKLGFCATCIPGGAKEKLSQKIKQQLFQLKGKHVVCLPDNDEIGRAFMAMVAGCLI